MSNPVFQAKSFYRKLDSLLFQIRKRADTKDILAIILDELVSSVGDDLMIESGCFYELRHGNYQLVKGPVGKKDGSWPGSIPIGDHSIELLQGHKSYIFADVAEIPPWGNNSVAVLLGEESQYLFAFRLAQGWIRESLQFSLNTVRSILNYSRDTKNFRTNLEEAHEIQMRLLPSKEPQFEGYDISGRSIAAEVVGGDLYDYHNLDEDVLGIAIGDASGHGLPAALMARDVVTGLRMGVEKEMKIVGVINKLNRVLHRSSISTRFVSMVYGELEKNGTFVYVNAGHPPPLLFKDSEVVDLQVGGPILGPIAAHAYERRFAFMAPGDVLFLYTDGVVEIVNRRGEVFGRDGVIKFVETVKNRSSEEILEKFFSHISSFSGERFKDDATVVIIKRQSS
jgi:hypothetical protein